MGRNLIGGEPNDVNCSAWNEVDHCRYSEPRAEHQEPSQQSLENSSVVVHQLNFVWLQSRQRLQTRRPLQLEFGERRHWSFCPLKDGEVECPVPHVAADGMLDISPQLDYGGVTGRELLPQDRVHEIISKSPKAVSVHAPGEPARGG